MLIPVGDSWIDADAIVRVKPGPDAGSSYVSVAGVEPSTLLVRETVERLVSRVNSARDEPVKVRRTYL